MAIPRHVQWDLNTGQMVRMYGTPRISGANTQEVVSLGLRPLTPLGTATNPHSELFSGGDTAAGMLPSNKSGTTLGHDRDGDEDGDSGSSDGSLFGDDSGDDDEGGGGNQKKGASKANGVQAQNSGPNATRSSNHSNSGGPMLSPDIVMTAYIDGQVLLWDRRNPSQSKPLRLEMGEKSPPWCVSACWSSNGHEIYAGRRIGTIDVWDIRQAGASSASGPRLLKSLRNPASSGPVTCVAGFPDGQHLVCASQDNIRLWKVHDETLVDHHRRAPFKIIAGHHGGVISQILIDASSRFMITASGNRGRSWMGESTKTVLIHDITPIWH
ncbi:hypothetical protein M407DRAFT_184089 [Tulasnella calospora MUT 4182]|uniref:Transcription factor spt8 beta-propeller domain-containing protein n=1 Tax=Tulasnella calospora MUT 4182 TaxID=1051891 RepID=A0A0C3QL01_9AGAM|nr:hypothetical protein M407DRAFT_184089 [Tulasnella calospora MUT 4182]